MCTRTSVLGARFAMFRAPRTQQAPTGPWNRANPQELNSRNCRPQEPSAAASICRGHGRCPAAPRGSGSQPSSNRPTSPGDGNRRPCEAPPGSCGRAGRRANCATFYNPRYSLLFNVILLLALRRRCVGCPAGGAAPRAKGLSGRLARERRCGAAALVNLRAECRPNGPRRRFRRRVPVNPGRRAGEAARETAAGRAGRRATGDVPPQIRPEACPGASLAPLRPRGVAPGPSHAG